MGSEYNVSTQLYLKNGDENIRLGEIENIRIERGYIGYCPTIDLRGILDAPVKNLKEFKKIFLSTQKEVPMPKKYIINHGATVLMWDDGDKTVVKRCADDEFNKRLGFLTAFFQHYSGMSKNKANKFLAELEVEDEEKEEAKETNSENKFRVGDKVKFRKNIKDTYGIDESDIDKMKNKIFEITEISEPRIGKNFYSYYTSIGYFVREDMIEKGDK